MQRITFALAALAALMFIVASATINSLFLSSLGRTSLEAGLFAAVSLASDITKAILPVVMAWALARRAWFHAALAGVFLAMAMTLSLGSGVGFAVSNRGAVTAEREELVLRLAQARADLAEADRRLAALASARGVATIEEDLRALLVNRLWSASDACAHPSSRAARRFCAKAFQMRAELAMAKEAIGLSSRRQALRAKIVALRTQGAGTVADPQAKAFAELAGLAPRMVRFGLMIVVAVVLELGSVCLLLLIAGPAIAQAKTPRATARKPKAAKTTRQSSSKKAAQPVAQPVTPAVLPMQTDRLQWVRKRMKQEA